MKVLGYSDDIVLVGEKEIDCFDKDVVVVFDDATVIRVGYSKRNLGVWWIELVHQGSCENLLEICMDEDAEIYSDVFHTNADAVCAFTTSQKYPHDKPIDE